MNLRLSLSTVYNTLRLFVEAGLIREIAQYGAGVWYDTKTGPHWHYFDEERNLLFDIPFDLSENLKIAPPRGRRVAGIDIIVRLEADGAAKD